MKPRSPRCSVTPGGSCFSRCSQRNCRHIPPLPLGQTHRHAHEQAAHTTQRAHWHLVSSVPGRRGAGHRYTDTHAYYTHLQIELSFMPAAMVGWLPAGLHLTGVWLVARLLPGAVPGASKPSKLLLQYSIELPLGVPSLPLPGLGLCELRAPPLERALVGVPSLERALGFASACSSSPSLWRHRLLHCPERREGGGRGRVCVPVCTL